MNSLMKLSWGLARNEIFLKDNTIQYNTSVISTRMFVNMTLTSVITTRSSVI
jgi:hypothetical protein